MYRKREDDPLFDMTEEEELEATEKGQVLARELREEAARQGIDLESADYRDLLPLVDLLPNELIQDAKDIAKASAMPEAETDQMLVEVVKIALLADERALLN
jgi:hypothetical protein